MTATQLRIMLQLLHESSCGSIARMYIPGTATHLVLLFRSFRDTHKNNTKRISM